MHKTLKNKFHITNYLFIALLLLKKKEKKKTHTIKKMAVLIN
jgi:hypothetical protein